MRLTDDTGIIQHATFSVPARASGYCVDDNARALMVALHADALSGSADTKRLVSTYLGFSSRGPDAGRAVSERNELRRDLRRQGPSQRTAPVARCGRWERPRTSRATKGSGCWRRQMFERGLPEATELGPRGTALTILGLTAFLARHPEVRTRGRPAGRIWRRRLCHRYRRQATADWRWFEPALTYDNALLPLALWRAHRLTRDAESRDVAGETLEFLETTCFRDDRLVLIGNAGWHVRGGARSDADEQPTDAAAFVLAFRGAYLVTRNHSLPEAHARVLRLVSGRQPPGCAVYDSATAGCRDGLGEKAANLNQGAESTVSFLLSLIEMLELAGEGLEHAPRVEAGR